jgi:hypothetical protein
MNKEYSSNIQNDTNKRIYERNIPSHTIQPYISVRSASTKYSIMPILEPRINNIDTPVAQYATYSPHKVFNPGNSKSPWSGFASEINTESQLRNQIYALQRNNQSVYVPNSDSDLYNYSFTPIQNLNQPFVHLFQEEKFNSFNPNPENLGRERFNNSTRVQLKNLSNR